MHLTSLPSTLVTHLATPTQTYHTSPHTPMRKQVQETESLSSCALNSLQNIYKQTKTNAIKFKINFTPFKPIILLTDNINVKNSNFWKFNKHPSLCKFFKHPALENVLNVLTAVGDIKLRLAQQPIRLTRKHSNKSIWLFKTNHETTMHQFSFRSFSYCTHKFLEVTNFIHF